MRSGNSSHLHESLQVATDLARHNSALKHANESLASELGQLSQQLATVQSNAAAAKATSLQADVGKASAAPAGSQAATWDELKLQVAQEVRLPSHLPFNGISARRVIVVATAVAPQAPLPHSFVFSQ